MVESLQIQKQEIQDGDSANADAGSKGGRSSNEGEFNFNKEINEYKEFVKDMQLSEVQEGIQAILTLETLEGDFYRLSWSVAFGITIAAEGQSKETLDASKGSP